MGTTYEDILTFWFKELGKDKWFESSEETDRLITERFSDLHQAVAAGEKSAWRESAEGALAEVIALDQFSRNLYRGKPEAFAFDGQALVLAQVAIRHGFDHELPSEQRAFFYMPFMHSESRLIHTKAVELFTALKEAESLKFEHIHKDIIDQFGRYPHRNEQLGRVSTPAEAAYLKETEHGFFSS